MKLSNEEISSILETDQPCPDVSKRIDGSVMDALSHVVDTNQPAIIPMVGNDLVVITEQAYKYFLSKCTKDELWDLGFLGQSEKHIKSASVSTLQEMLTPIRNQLKDMNSKPWKYATHCLKADPYNSIFICKEGQQQLLFINGNWEPSDVYVNLLEKITTEYHPDIDKECNLISRKDIQHFQKVLEQNGLDALKQNHTDLCNSNSMGAVPSIVAINVVLFNNDLHL